MDVVGLGEVQGVLGRGEGDTISGRQPRDVIDVVSDLPAAQKVCLDAEDLDRKLVARATTHSDAILVLRFLVAVYRVDEQVCEVVPECKLVVNSKRIGVELPCAARCM